MSRPATATKPSYFKDDSFVPCVYGVESTETTVNFSDLINCIQHPKPTKADYEDDPGLGILKSMAKMRTERHKAEIAKQKLIYLNKPVPEKPSNPFIRNESAKITMNDSSSGSNVSLTDSYCTKMDSVFKKIPLLDFQSKANNSINSLNSFPAKANGSTYSFNSSAFSLKPSFSINPELQPDDSMSLEALSYEMDQMTKKISSKASKLLGISETPVLSSNKKNSGVGSEDDFFKFRQGSGSSTQSDSFIATTPPSLPDRNETTSFLNNYQTKSKASKLLGISEIETTNETMAAEYKGRHRSASKASKLLGIEVKVEEKTQPRIRPNKESMMPVKRSSLPNPGLGRSSPLLLSRIIDTSDICGWVSVHKSGINQERRTSLGSFMLNRKTWKNKFVVLNHITLFRFDSADSTSVASDDRLQLNPQTRVYVPQDFEGLSHVISINNPGRSPYYIKCSSGEELTEWLTALKSGVLRSKFLMRGLPALPGFDSSFSTDSDGDLSNYSTLNSLKAFQDLHFKQFRTKHTPNNPDFEISYPLIRS